MGPMSASSDCEWDNSGNWSACSFFFLSNHSEANACAQFRDRECVCPDNDDDDAVDVGGCAVSSETRECSTRNCLQIHFDTDGHALCAPKWSLEAVNDLWVGNHIVQRGGFMGEQCVVIEEEVEYLLVIADGCGAVSWSFQGAQIGEYTFLEHEAFNEKSFQIVVHERLNTF